MCKQVTKVLWFGYAGAGEKAQWLRALTACAEDWGLVPSTHIGSQLRITEDSRNLLLSSGLCRHCTQMHALQVK